MSRLRILVLGSDCDPHTVSIPFVTFSHAAALAEQHEVTLVAKSYREDALRQSRAPFRAIEVVHTPLLDRIFDWGFRKIFKSNYASQALTAFRYPFTIAFELYAWRRLRARIQAGEFDVVLRVVPLTAVLPSPFAFFLRKGPIPFVIGPLNGGLPWTRGFSRLGTEKEWISDLRSLYRLLPFARSTYRHAAAIIVASSQTYSEFTEFRDKLFFVPENGIKSSACSGHLRQDSPDAPLELIFVGGLSPRKACDLGLRAAAPLLRSGQARFTVAGDGTERARLEELAKLLDIEKSVTFCGWLNHADVISRLQTSDVLVFPSIRDFGGGVIFEALASGSVPVVVDFGGPGDIVNSDVGFKVPLTNEGDMVLQIQEILENLAKDRRLLSCLRERGVTFAREHLTWDAKAQRTTQVLNWVMRRGPKPNFPPPKMLFVENAR